MWHLSHNPLLSLPIPSSFCLLEASTLGLCSRENRGLPLPLQSPLPSIEQIFHSRRGKRSMCVTPLSWKLSLVQEGAAKKNWASFPHTQPTLVGRRLYYKHDRPKILDPHDSHPSSLLGHVFHAKRASQEDLGVRSPSPTSL